MYTKTEKTAGKGKGDKCAFGKRRFSAHWQHQSWPARNWMSVGFALLFPSRPFGSTKDLLCVVHVLKLKVTTLWCLHSGKIVFSKSWRVYESIFLGKCIEGSWGVLVSLFVWLQIQSKKKDVMYYILFVYLRKLKVIDLNIFTFLGVFMNRLFRVC